MSEAMTKTTKKAEDIEKGNRIWFGPDMDWRPVVEIREVTNNYGHPSMKISVEAKDGGVFQ